MKEEIKPIKAGYIPYPNSDKGHQSNTFYSIEGLCPAIDTCGGGNREPKIMEENRFFKQAFETINENDCQVGDTIDAFNKKVNDSGVSPTVTTRPEGFKTAILVVDEPLVYDGFNQQIRADQSTVGALTRNVGADLKRNGQGIIEPLAYDEQNKYLRKDGIVGTLTTDGSSPKHNNRVVETSYRVRKLTERECFKLMGVKVEDFEKIRKNQSKSSCYHLAGDSIVSTVLMALFGQMLDIDWKNRIKESGLL